MRRDESGVVTVWGVALIGLLTLLAVVAFAVTAVVAGHRRAQAAADLAALAGAGSLQHDRDGCRSAAHIARRNDAVLVSCAVEQWRVRVVVAVPVPGLLGREHRLRARALAGPGR